MSEERSWLILSLKWSEGKEFAVWYKPGACGYTINLEEAGRFTEEEARERTSGGEGTTAMVRKGDAYDHAVQRTVVVASGTTIASLMNGPKRRLPTIKEMSGLIKDFTRGKSMKEYMEELSDE